MPIPNDFEELFARRLSRRDALGGLAGAFALGAWPRGPLGLRGIGARAPRDDPAVGSTLTFREVPHGSDDLLTVPEGYRADVLLARGDPLFADAPPFRAGAPTAAAQTRQFGANADWVAWLPVPGAERDPDRALLAVNHEFAGAHMMLPGLTHADVLEHPTREQCELEMAAVGLSIVEVAREEGRWRAVTDGRFNRRVHALGTRVALSGPAAKHPRLRAEDDPEGLRVRTFNNCAGGVTPWGTVLTCEENFNWHFAGHVEEEGDTQAEEAARERANHARYQVGDELVYGWHLHFPHFDVAHAPHEPNRYGWVVELDPRDPTSTPVKRTALGRVKHESASCAVAPDGRVAVYGGDDDEDEHLYRFVTRRAWDPEDRAANRDLLDEGELQVARFDEDGTLEWLPLVHGQGPLTAENGFRDQGDVLIETRRAGSLVGGTRMDRPEDVEVHPDGRIYVMLTNNRGRPAPGPANPRAHNRAGHVIELIPPADEDGAPDHAARRYRWDVLLLAGDPRAEGGAAGRYHPDVSANGWLACPDNAAVDPRGRLWIATDGAPSAAGFADGVWACDVDGPSRALTRCFLRAPRGSEVCGPCFAPDGRTLFVSVQHPGVTDDHGRGLAEACFDAPTGRFPDHDDEVPPRSALVAIVREDGGEIGS